MVDRGLRTRGCPRNCARIRGAPCGAALCPRYPHVALLRIRSCVLAQHPPMTPLGATVFTATATSLDSMIVLLVFVLWAALELFVVIKVADAIGVLATVVLLLLTWPLGSWALRSRGPRGLAPTRGRGLGRKVARPRGARRRPRPGRRRAADRSGIPRRRPRRTRAAPADACADASPADPQPPAPLRGERDAVRRGRRGHTMSTRPPPTSTSPSCMHELHFTGIANARLRRRARTVWGAAWIPGRDDVGAWPWSEATRSPRSCRPCACPCAEAGGEWRLEGDGVALDRVARGRARRRAARRGRHRRLGPAVPRHRPVRRPSTRSIRLGLRSSWSGTFELAKFESIRAVSVWFEPDEGFALTAFRPRKAKAHDADLVAAAVIAPEAPRRSRIRGCPPHMRRRMAGPRRPRAVADRGRRHEQQYPRAGLGRGSRPPRTGRRRRARAAGRAVSLAQPLARGRRDVPPGPPAMSATRQSRGPGSRRSSRTSAACSPPRYAIRSSACSTRPGSRSRSSARRWRRSPSARDPTRCSSSRPDGSARARFMGALADELSARRGSRVELDGFGERYFRHLDPNDRMIEYMHELRERGYKLAICTNNVREWEARWRAMLPVDEIFDVVVDSAFVGARKPEPRIYRDHARAARRLRREATLFIDDVEVNCRGRPRARHRGDPLPLDRPGDRGDRGGAGPGARRPGVRPASAQAILAIARNAFVSLDADGRVLEWNSPGRGAVRVLARGGDRIRPRRADRPAALSRAASRGSAPGGRRATARPRGA